MGIKRQAEPEEPSPPAKRQRLSKTKAAPEAPPKAAAKKSLKKKKQQAVEVKAEAANGVAACGVNGVAEILRSPFKTLEGPCLWQICHMTLMRRSR